MYIAEMESECFCWRAYGRTEQEAINGIVELWNSHPSRERMTEAELEKHYDIRVERCCSANNRYW